MGKISCHHPRLQNSRFRSFRKARSALSVILECEAREPHTPAGRVPFLLSLLTFRSNMIRRSRSQKIRLFLQSTIILSTVDSITSTVT